MRTFEEIRGMLADKFHKEKLRLKSYGTKADSFDLANSVARYVQSLMTESRYSELKRVERELGNTPGHQSVSASGIPGYIIERKRATKAMAQALQNEAEKTEKARPWKRKPEEKKEKHHHGSHRSSRSSRD